MLRGCDEKRISLQLLKRVVSERFESLEKVISYFFHQYSVKDLFLYLLFPYFQAAANAEIICSQELL